MIVVLPLGDIAVDMHLPLVVVSKATFRFIEKGN